MKCPEAVEWMHRYIDDDLDEEESSLLFEHIRKCRNCVEQFELLKKLSVKLEDLPKVTPNFNLVDKIMPQLEEIDRGRREGGSTIEAIPVMAKEAADGDRSPRGKRNKAADRRRRFYRMGTLGVAAAMILGVFIYQYEPRMFPDAEVVLDNQHSGSEGAENTSSSANLDVSGEDAFSQNTDSKTDPAGPVDLTETPAKEDKKKPELDDNRLDKGGKNAKGALDASGGVVDDGKKSTGKPGSDSDGKDANLPEYSNQEAMTDPKVSNFPANVLTLNPSVNDSGKDVNSPGDSEKVLVPDENGEQLDLKKNSLAGDGLAKRMIQGIPKIEDVNSWASPDGIYEAELKDGHIYMYKKEFQDRTLVSDHELDGDWVKGEWSEDGKTFTFETEKEETVKAHKIEVE